MAATDTKLDREILVLGAVVVTGTIMAILDATIVNVAIPTLGRDLHTSISTIQWVMTGYLLAFASVIPLTGWASERFGAKRVWIAALLVFMAGSALAGSAWSIEALICFRLLQGVGGGLLMPVGQTILAQAAGPKRIGRVMSVVGVPMLLGPIVGPVVGGVAVGIAFVALFAGPARRRGRGALIDVSLFARRGFAAAAGTNLLVGVALFGALILLPLYYQIVRGESPLATGLLLVPQGLGAALAMPIAGRLTDEIGARVVIPFGIVLALLGTAAYTQVAADSSYAFLAGSLFLIGLGLGATIVPSMAVAYQAVPREAVAHATSAINVIQRISGSVGTALLAVVLQHEIDAAHSRSAAALANAFGTTFWVAFGLVATALVPALLLPRLRPR